MNSNLLKPSFCRIIILGIVCAGFAVGHPQLCAQDAVLRQIDYEPQTGDSWNLKLTARNVVLKDLESISARHRGFVVELMRSHDGQDQLLWTDLYIDSIDNAWKRYAFDLKSGVDGTIMVLTGENFSAGVGGFTVYVISDEAEVERIELPDIPLGELESPTFELPDESEPEQPVLEFLSPPHEINSLFLSSEMSIEKVDASGFEVVATFKDFQRVVRYLAEEDKWEWVSGEPE